MCAGEIGAYLGCDGGIAKQVHAFTLFEVCTCVVCKKMLQGNK